MLNVIVKIAPQRRVFSFLTLLYQHLPGPEAFNYGFPQDLDDEFLVICDSFSGVPWKYVNSEELVEILCERIDEGFTFPLNPKWILCDNGWKNVYDRLLASRLPNAQDSLDVWYPPEIREKIAKVSSKHPRGFVWDDRESLKRNERGITTDLAILEFRKFMTQERVFCHLKTVVHGIIIKNRLLLGISSSENSLESGSITKKNRPLLGVRPSEIGLMSGSITKIRPFIQRSASDYGINTLTAALQMNLLAKQAQDKFPALCNGGRCRRESFALSKKMLNISEDVEEEEDEATEEAELRQPKEKKNISPRQAFASMKRLPASRRILKALKEEDDKGKEKEES